MHAWTARVLEVVAIIFINNNVKSIIPHGFLCQEQFLVVWPTLLPRIYSSSEVTHKYAS
jgi:hypothetical protein